MSDAFESNTMTGADLSRYQDELAHERNARTLTLRRQRHLSIETSLTATVSRRYGTLTDAAKFPYLNIEKAFATLQSGDPTELSELSAQLISAVKGAPRSLKSLLGSSEFIERFLTALKSPQSPALTIKLLEVVIAIFPLLGTLMIDIIDGGLCSILTDFLISSDSSIITSTLRTISVICDRSSYARDSALCLELHNTLIEMALSQSPSELADHCCNAVLSIFRNCDQIDSEILIGAIEPLIQILSVGSVQTVASVLDCFVVMTNQHSALVHTLYEQGMFSRVVEFLNKTELVAPALRLIGNLSVAQPFQLRIMLEAGLIVKVLDILESEHAADVFWVLSNLLEAVPALILPLIDADFVDRLFEIIDTSGYDIQKEAAFFLSTLILFSPEAEVQRFVMAPVIEILVGMVGCGVEKVVLRCIYTIGKLVRWGRKGGETLKWVAESDLMDRLGELVDDPEQPLMVERAEALISQVKAAEGDKKE
jgi:hypothetical protein